MKNQLLILVMLVCSMFTTANSSKNKPPINWETYSFTENNKLKLNAKGGFKDLAKYPTVISSYQLVHASLTSGSEKTATSSVKLVTRFAGVKEMSIQKLTDKLHQDFVGKLGKITKLTPLNPAFETSVTEKKAPQLNYGTANGKPFVHGLGPLKFQHLGYNAGFVKEEVLFNPTNTPFLYHKNAITAGMYFQKLSKQLKANIVQISYHINYCFYDGSRGYSTISVKANPVITIHPKVMLYTPRGMMSAVYFGKPIWGNSNWTANPNGKIPADEIFGNGNSKEVFIYADEETYLAEISAMITKMQSEIVKAIE